MAWERINQRLNAITTSRRRLTLDGAFGGFGGKSTSISSSSTGLGCSDGWLDADGTGSSVHARAMLVTTREILARARPFGPMTILVSFTVTFLVFNMNIFGSFLGAIVDRVGIEWGLMRGRYKYIRRARKKRRVYYMWKMARLQCRKCGRKKNEEWRKSEQREQRRDRKWGKQAKMRAKVHSVISRQDRWSHPRSTNSVDNV